MKGIASCGILSREELISIPGLAVFVMDTTYSAEEALVMLLHEFLPLLRPGQTVQVLDRAGNRICSGSIMELRMSAKDDRTAVISLIVRRKYDMETRAMATLHGTNPFR